jgi:hypothetical protein
VLGKVLSADERRAIGGFVTREEIAAAIEAQLGRASQFPAEGEGGSQIVVGETGASVIARRRTSQQVRAFASVRDAIEHYIDVEIGPSCGGVLVK